MSIPVECECGKTVWAPPAAANQTIQCSRCQTVLPVPVPELDTVLELPILAGPPFGHHASAPAARHSRVRTA